MVTFRRCVYVCSLLILPLVAVMGLERTSYQLFSGANSAEVCVSVSEPSPDVSSCPITFPLDLNFHLTDPSSGIGSQHWTYLQCHNPILLSDLDYFVVDETQSPRPEGGIDREDGDIQDIILQFNSCQRRMCFDVSLRESVSRPAPDRYGIRVARTPDHGRNIVVDPNTTSGYIETL